MDYPVSDEFAKLNNGKFTDGDPLNDVPPSRNSAMYQNAVYDELLNVISGGGLTPDEAELNQVFLAIGNIAKSIVSSQTAGQIANFPGTMVPDGWLKAAGQTVNRASYPYLFNYAESSGNIAASEAEKQDGQFGPGDGSSTFSLPDLRGVFVRNLDDGKGIDGSRQIGTHQDDANKSHTHTASTSSAGSHGHSASTGSAGTHSHDYPVRRKNLNSGNVTAGNFTIAGGLADNYDDQNYDTSSAGGHTHSVSVASGGDHSHDVSVGDDGGTEVRVKNIALMACIKY